MMKEKTLEEIRAAVLAFCERVCPDKEKAKLDLGHLVFGYVTDGDKEYEAFFICISASINPISLYALSSDEVWIVAYRLLGLDKADAVEATESLFLEKFAVIQQSRDIEREMHTLTLKDLKAERTRNAALVAALESAFHHCGYYYANGNGDHYGRGGEEILTAAGAIIKNALEANKKGEFTTPTESALLTAAKAVITANWYRLNRDGDMLPLSDAIGRLAEAVEDCKKGGSNE